MDKTITPPMPRDIYDRLEREWRVIDPDRPEQQRKLSSLDDSHVRLRISRVD